MLDLFVASDLAVRGTRAEAWSARPDAPVVAPRKPSPRAARTRTVLAASLRRAAATLEPREQRDRSVARGATPACQ
jgi:hypothetical protein